MLASLRLSSVRNALVIVLVALSAFMAVQRAQAVIDVVQHALAIDHAAPAMELAVVDHDHDVDPPGADDPQGGAERDHAPGTHHHHSEGPQFAAMTASVTVEIAVSRSQAAFRRADAGSPQSRIFGLERPPKALERQA
ncbi:MAG: hypothetical protein JNL41_18210 [Phenylobacterium sp.]|uniref:hypothetical protein n=1 Tax=Phenylobacterium sp. TaxID=1871053 RepID=UPI001A429B2A|nr:hypothetical protein [Phenylobacterium sp.]MBL8556217.1 hypothetical protein [Phenylobacterium sp.]